MNVETWSLGQRWPLSRVLILLLAGGFAGLMLDIRVEHVDVVRERPVAWLPIIYSGFMMIACAVAFLIWSRKMRRAMIPLFLLAIALGSLGFYFHNHGNLKQVITTSANAWTDWRMNHPDTPPQLAPLAFAGLGTIGVLTCLTSFDSSP